MEVVVPKENNNDQMVMISRLYVADGAYIEEGSDLIEFETSKTAVVLQAPASGYVSFLYGEESEVEVNSVVCTIDAEPPKSDSEELTIDVKKSAQKGVKDDVVFSKKAKLDYKDDVDLEGKLWVTSRMFARNGLESNLVFDRTDSRNTTLDQAVSAATVTDHNQLEDEYKPAKTSMRKRSEINSLGISGGGVFQSTIGLDIFSGTRVVPSIMFDNSIQDLICYESSKMLGNEFKDLNAFYISKNEIGLFSNVSAGISLDSLNKLTVARITNSDKKSLEELQGEIGALIIKFEDGAFAGDDLKASTFTITDLSSSGASYMRPLLNGAESLIIGVVRRSENCFGLYASFDHRVTAGLRVANFLDSLKLRVESHFLPNSAVIADQCGFCMKSLEEEVGSGQRGMLLISTISGQKNICRNCYEGW